MRPWSGLALRPRISSTTRSGASFADVFAKDVGDFAPGQERAGDVFMVRRADLLERVRERIVPDVVQQRGGGDDPRFSHRRLQLTARREQRERATGEVPGAERVLEPRVRRARVDEVREPELPHVPQPLECPRVDEADRQVVERDVVPERVPDDVKQSRCEMGDGRPENNCSRPRLRGTTWPTPAASPKPAGSHNKCS